MRQTFSTTNEDETSSSNSKSSKKQDESSSSIKSLSIKYALSSLASAVAETVTYPLDIVKTRLQIQGELIGKDIHASNRISHGMFGVGLSIVKNEGILQLWAGVTPAVYRHLVYTGSRLVFYEQFRDHFRNNNQEFPLWKAVLVGVSSGALAQFIASPTDLVKVIMQAEGKRKLEGLPPRFRNVNHAFVEIYRQGGVRGLWRGCAVNVKRAALVSLGDLATYDLVKRYFMNNFGFRDDYKVHTISSICSGLLAAVMGTPADVIKTRIMNQPVDSSGRGTIYKSSWHCTVLTYQHEGFRGLYKGFWPTWARMAPWSLTFWLTYEEIRKVCGLSGF